MKDYKSNWHYIQPKVNDQREEALQEEKKRKEITQSKDCKSDWDNVQPNVNNQRAETLKEEKKNRIKIQKQNTHLCYK